MHSDIGWAIVTLVERTSAGGQRETPLQDADLVEVSGGFSLIVVNPDLLSSLPGVQMIPLSKTQAFLALESGRGMADLELAMVDRLEELGAGQPESIAVTRLRDQLRRWRKDVHLAFHSRSIILVAKTRARTRRRTVVR
jgi:hypothetical protein